MLYLLVGLFLSTLLLGTLLFLYCKIKTRHKKLSGSTLIVGHWPEKRVLFSILLCFAYIAGFFILTFFVLQIEAIYSIEGSYKLVITIIYLLPVLLILSLFKICSSILSEIYISDDFVTQIIVPKYKLEEHVKTHRLSDIVSAEIIPVSYYRTGHKINEEKYFFLFVYNKRRHRLFKIETRSLGYTAFYETLKKQGVPISIGKPRNHYKKSVLDAYFK